ncbi:MAG: hypothetical protein ACYC96_12170 [Fimbriimonadaceae bacterium]
MKILVVVVLLTVSLLGAGGAQKPKVVHGRSALAVARARVRKDQAQVESDRKGIAKLDKAYRMYVANLGNAKRNRQAQAVVGYGRQVANTQKALAGARKRLAADNRQLAADTTRLKHLQSHA